MSGEESGKSPLVSRPPDQDRFCPWMRHRSRSGCGCDGIHCVKRFRTPGRMLWSSIRSERCARQIFSPRYVAPIFRAKYNTLLSEVQGSGAGAFDAERKCLLGIMSASMPTYRGQNRRGVFCASSYDRRFLACQTSFLMCPGTRSFRFLNGWPPVTRHSWVVIDVTWDCPADEILGYDENGLPQ